jgi:hypothetical protein
LAARGPRLTPPGRAGAGPLTQVHRPCARQAADVVGAPTSDLARFDDKKYPRMQPGKAARLRRVHCFCCCSQQQQKLGKLLYERSLVMAGRMCGLSRGGVRG